MKNRMMINKSMGRIKIMGVLRALGTLLAGLVLLTLARQALAEQLESHSLNYDRATPPWEFFIWASKDSAGLIRGSLQGLACQSDTDDLNGACPTRLSWGGGGKTNIQLRFTEKRSHNSVSLYVLGYVVTPCTNYVLTSTPGVCPYNPTSYVLNIPNQQLAKIPYGGIWEATLIFNLWDWNPAAKIDSYTVPVTLNVTDNNRADIFFPSYGTPNPTVNLNLSTHPADNRPVTGGAHVDLCLYDGYNSNSPWLTVKVSDPLSVPGRAADVFSLVDTAGQETSEAHRLDYHAALNYNGQSHVMSGGQPVQLTGTDKGPVRQTSLPGVQGTVLCAPASLDLNVLPFKHLEKSAGHYSGTLRLELAPTTQTP